MLSISRGNEWGKVMGKTETAKFIKKRRLQNGLTQEDLARFLGCTKIFISRIESGMAALPPAKVTRASKILKVDRSEVIEVIQSDLDTKLFKKAR